MKDKQIKNIQNDRLLNKDDTKETLTDDKKIDMVAAKILKEYRQAFEELAK